MKRREEYQLSKRAERESCSVSGVNSKFRIVSTSIITSVSKVVSVFRLASVLRLASAFGLVIGLTVLGIALDTVSTSHQVFATSGFAKKDISLEVLSSCSVSGGDNTYSNNLATGTYGVIGSGNVFQIYCNDPEGYVVYAVGNGKNIEMNNEMNSGTGESTGVTETKEGVTDLIGLGNSNNRITTGINQGGETSNWMFKLSNASLGMTINNGFESESLVPTTRTSAVSRESGTATNVGDTFTATYSAYISPSQKNDTYTGGVKYILFHPSSVGPEGPLDNACEIDGEKTNTLTDSRDGKTYSIATLADGKCWMTENLRIQNATLTPENSDVASNFVLPASTDKPNASNAYDSTELHVDDKYGGYYTWYTATAGEGTQDIAGGQSVEHSVCPKGWRLPTKQDFIDLDKALGGTGENRSDSTMYNTYMGSPNNFLMGGFYTSGTAYNVGSDAGYWSSTAYNASRAYYLYFLSSNVNPQTYNDKYYLFSVRCVSRSTDPTMQNVEKWGSTVKSGETKTVPDIRDGKEYTVARLADNKLWMTKNLEIENYNLTSNDSDVSTDFSIPASTDRPNSSNSYTSKDLHVDSRYGGYYTWYTATAGEGTQDISTNGQNVERSICPKGWRLPTKDEFVALDKALGGTGENGQSSSTDVGGGKTLLQMYQEAPANFLMGGLYSSGNPGNVGSTAYYWSSTAYDANYAYNLYFYSSLVYPQSYGDKYYLRSVRCVSRQ